LREPLVSVVVPVYNGERYLSAALQSIMDQDYRETEVIVVDDGSVDGSAPIAKSFDGIRYIRQANQGVASAWNVGIAAAQGELIAFLAQDDVWTPTKLSVQVGYLLSNECVQYVIAKARYFLEPGCAIPPGFRRELLSGDHVARIVETMLARRLVFDIVGGFDATLSSSQDVDWFGRAKDAGVAMALIPQVLLRRRIHEGNLTYHLPPESRGDLLRIMRRSIKRQTGKEHGPRTGSTTRSQNGMISVIIPVYNGERYLAEAIESALGQTREADEVIVVDDGSTDGSAAVAGRFGPPVRCVFQTNAGAPAARNHGARLARGQFLSFLDADDVWVESKLALQMSCFDENPELDLVNGHIEQFISEDVDEASRRRIVCPEGAMPAPGPVSMLIRREALFRVGLFDTRCAVGESIDWYARAMDEGLRSITLADTLARRRLHHDNISYLDRESGSEYLRVVRESLARRRKARSSDRDGENGL